MSTFFDDKNKRASGSFNAFGRRKAPIQIGASGVDANLLPKLSAPRFSLSKTFTGITSGVSVLLIDRLFSVEANGIWKAQIIRSGTVDQYGQVTFDRLRDSIYSLLVVDLAHTDESIHDVIVGDPERFDTIAKHAVPSQPYIFNTEYADTGTTAQATLFWRLGADGVDGYPEVYYTTSGTGQWTLFSRFEDESIYSAVVQPLAYSTNYEFKLRLINEDLIAGPWSNITTVSSSDLTVSGGTGSGNQLVLHMDFEDKTDIFKDISSQSNVLTGGVSTDYTVSDSIYGDISYYCDSGVASLEVDSSDLYLETSAPYNSYIFEGTFKVLASATSTSMGLFGGNGSMNLSLTTGTTHVQTVRFNYGTSLIQFTIPDSGKRETWPLGETKHITAIFDASSATFRARLYIDGVLVGDDTAAFTAINGSQPISIFASAGAIGYKGAADEIKFWKVLGTDAPDDSDSYIRSTIPAPGVFNTGFGFPRAELNANTYSGGSNPQLTFHNTDSDIFFDLTASGLIISPDTAVAGYVWTCDSDGIGSWTEVSGTGSTSLYNTALSTGLAMPEDVGGITAGTTVDDLLGDSFISLFDDLLFPTVLAYQATAKSLVLSDGLPTTYYEVGTSFTPSLTGTFASGLINNGNGTAGPPVVGGCSGMRFYDPDGGLVGVDTTIIAGVGSVTASPAWSTSSVETFYFSAQADHVAGVGDYYDNKNNSGSYLDATRVSDTITDTPNPTYTRYYLWYGMGPQNSAPMVSTGVRGLPGKDFLTSANLTDGYVDIVIPASTQEVYFYTISGKTISVQYVESSYAELYNVDEGLSAFTTSGQKVNDAGSNPVEYQRFVNYIGAGGYPSEATYRVRVT